MSKFKFKSARKKNKIKLINPENEIINTQLLSGAHIEIFSNKSVLVDGCKKILEYENDYLKLKLKKGHIVLSGDEFIILSFENELISVKGNINSIEFCI